MRQAPSGGAFGGGRAPPVGITLRWSLKMPKHTGGGAGGDGHVNEPAPHSDKCRDGIWPGSWGWQSSLQEVTPTLGPEGGRESVGEKKRAFFSHQEDSHPLQVPHLGLKTWYSVYSSFLQCLSRFFPAHFS